MTDVDTPSATNQSRRARNDEVHVPASRTP